MTARPNPPQRDGEPTSEFPADIADDARDVDAAEDEPWDDDLAAADAEWLDDCFDDDEPAPEQGDFWWEDNDDDY